MKRTYIIREIRKAKDAGTQLSQGEWKFFRAICDTEDNYCDIPENTIICDDYIDDAEIFVKMMRRYAISKLISTDGWSGAMARGLELQKAGLRVKGFEVIEKVSIFGGKEKEIAGLAYTF